MSTPFTLVLLGATGQVGWELQRALAPLGRVLCLGRQHGADLADAPRLTQAVMDARPQVVVNAAAYTAVDRAEQPEEQQRCMDTNAGAPAALALVARELGALLVHYSSDYVFDGSGSAPFTEDDSPGASSLYGESKAAGDFAIEHSGCAHLILRSSWVYGARGHNFARTMLKLARERQQLRVVADQWGAPTGAELMADVTAHLIRHTLAQPQLSGLYHLAPSGFTTWHGYAQHVIEGARQRGATLALPPEGLEPIGTAQYPTAAARPLNSRLDTTKLQRTFGLTLPPWQQGVDRVLDEWLLS